MNSEFRIDILETRECVEKLDELKRCAREIAWRLDEARRAETDNPYKFSRCSQKAENLARYFDCMSTVLLDISYDADRTRRKIASLLEEGLQSNVRY